MGERAFEEVFPELRLSPAVERMIQGVKVTRIAMYNETGRMEVYLESTHLIEKEIIYRLEEELRSFLFGRSRMVVKIVERYLLSEAYTADKLLKLYMPSLLLELSKENHVSYGRRSRRSRKKGFLTEASGLLRSIREPLSARVLMRPQGFVWRRFPNMSRTEEPLKHMPGEGSLPESRIPSAAVWRKRKRTILREAMCPVLWKTVCPGLRKEVRSGQRKEVRPGLRKEVRQREVHPGLRERQREAKKASTTETDGGRNPWDATRIRM